MRDRSVVGSHYREECDRRPENRCLRRKSGNISRLKKWISTLVHNFSTERGHRRGQGKQEKQGT